VCGAEVGGSERAGLDAISWTWNTEQAVGFAIYSCDDRPSELLALPELGDGRWEIGDFISGKPS